MPHDEDPDDKLMKFRPSCGGVQPVVHSDIRNSNTSQLTSQLTVASSPGGKQDYYNRKGFPSIQLQLVVDDNPYIISALRAILAVLMMAAYLRTVHFVESWTLDSCR